MNVEFWIKVAHEVRILKSVESGDVAQGAEWSRFANEEMKSLALLTNDVALVALIKGDTFALDCNVPRGTSLLRVLLHSTFYFLHFNL